MSALIGLQAVAHRRSELATRFIGAEIQPESRPKQMAEFSIQQIALVVRRAVRSCHEVLGFATKWLLGTIDLANCLASNEL